MESTNPHLPKDLEDQIKSILAACRSTQIALNIWTNQIFVDVGYASADGEYWTSNVTFKSQINDAHETTSVEELRNFVTEGRVERLVKRQFVEKVKQIGPTMLVTFADLDRLDDSEAFEQAKRIAEADGSVAAERERLHAMTVKLSGQYAKIQYHSDRDNIAKAQIYLETYVKRGIGRKNASDCVGLQKTIAEACEPFVNSIPPDQRTIIKSVMFETMIAVDTRKVATKPKNDEIVEKIDRIIPSVSDDVAVRVAEILYDFKSLQIERDIYDRPISVTVAHHSNDGTTWTTNVIFKDGFGMNCGTNATVAALNDFVARGSVAYYAMAQFVARKQFELEAMSGKTTTPE